MGSAWCRRQQRGRADARHVCWLTSLLQASCSHHTSEVSGKGLLGTLASIEKRLLHVEEKLKDQWGCEAEEAKIAGEELARKPEETRRACEEEVAKLAAEGVARKDLGHEEQHDQHEQQQYQEKEMPLEDKGDVTELENEHEAPKGNQDTLGELLLKKCDEKHDGEVQASCTNDEEVETEQKDLAKPKSKRRSGLKVQKSGGDAAALEDALAQADQERRLQKEKEEAVVREVLTTKKLAACGHPIRVAPAWAKKPSRQGDAFTCIGCDQLACFVCEQKCGFRCCRSCLLTGAVQSETAKQKQ